jgi:hypothetical protein
VYVLYFILNFQLFLWSPYETPYTTHTSSGVVYNSHICSTIYFLKLLFLLFEFVQLQPHVHNQQ